MELGSIWQDVKGGLRLMAKRPGFTAAAVLSLALGIGANTTVFSLVSAVFLRPVPVQDADRVVSIYTQDARNNQFGYLGSSYLNLKDYRDQSTVFSGFSAIMGNQVRWLRQGTPQPLAVSLVNADFFSLLGEKITIGRDFRPDEDGAPGANPVAILSYALWSKQFGAQPSAIGQTMELNGLPFTIIGVAPADFHDIGVLGNPDVWVPMAMHDQILTGIVKTWFNQRRPLFAGAVARLKPGVTLKQAQLELSGLAQHLAQEFPTDDAGRGVALVPFTESNINPNARPAFLLAGALLLAIAGLVLLIACANVANLLLVRAAQRRREFAIRLALGGGRGRLLRQLLTESLLLGLLGAGVGIGLAYLARNALWSLRPPGVGNNVHPALSAGVLWFTLGAALVATVLFGLAPALQATRTAPLASLRDRTDVPAGGQHWYSLRGLLVVAQVAFSLIALIGASLFVHSLVNAQKVNLGFDAPHLAVLDPNLAAANYTQARADQFFKDALGRLQALPQIAGVGLSDTRPLSGGLQRTTFPDGVDTSDTRNGKLTPILTVGPGYFRAMGIPLLRGRDISANDIPGSPLVAVINDTLANRLWPGQDPIGKHLRFLQETWDVTVVGEVPTVKYATLGEEPQAQVYFALEQQFTPNALFLVRTSGDPSAILGSLRAVAKGLDPSLPQVQTQLVEQRIDNQLAAPTLGAELLAVFGLLALLLAAIGTYGVMSYSVTQRGREIGVRMALGARGGDVMRLILGSGMTMVVVGVGLGVVAAAVLGQGLGSILYGIGGFDWVSFTTAPAILLAAALVACWLPAQRALRIDPNRALRDE
jgi:putative ABC transport system permease protein